MEYVFNAVACMSTVLSPTVAINTSAMDLDDVGEAASRRTEEGL